MTASVQQANEAPTILSDLRVGSYTNCVIHVWSGQIGPEQIEAVNRHTARVDAAYPSGFAVLALVEAGAPLPSSDGKRALEGYFAQYSGRMLAVAYVAEGTGLWASMARSVMTALQLVRKRSYPTKVLSESAGGIEWLGTFLAREDGSTVADAQAGLRRYLESLRRST